MPRKATTKKTETAAAVEAPVSVAAAIVEKAEEVVEKTVKAARKPAEKKAAEKKTTEKKPVVKKPSIRKTVKKEDGPETEVFLQYWGKEIRMKDIKEKIEKIWTDEMGNKAADLKDLKIYVKPEDDGAHYVINGEITGFVSL